MEWVSSRVNMRWALYELFCSSEIKSSCVWSYVVVVGGWGCPLGCYLVTGRALRVYSYPPPLLSGSIFPTLVSTISTNLTPPPHRPFHASRQWPLLQALPQSVIRVMCLSLPFTRLSWSLIPFPCLLYVMYCFQPWKTVKNNNCPRRLQFFLNSTCTILKKNHCNKCEWETLLTSTKTIKTRHKI